MQPYYCQPVLLSALTFLPGQSIHLMLMLALMHVHMLASAPNIADTYAPADSRALEECAGRVEEKTSREREREREEKSRAGEGEE